MYKKIEKCRICGNTRLERVLDLGEQMLTGVFPREKKEKVTSGPLRLVRCTGGDEVCGLLQLEHSYDLGEMYGENYGYRSGLNASMVEHLHDKVKKILKMASPRKGDIVIDIGSNDGTTLRAYPADMATLVGFDPTGVKFRAYYPEHVQLIPDFYSAALFGERFPGKKARVITSFSMFYDLEDPISFMRDIYSVLADDGIWVFEQSYMPTMLDMNSYDTVCHEHLEYYGLSQIKWMTDRVGFRILDVELNDVNGGSFSVVVSKQSNDTGTVPVVKNILDTERSRGLHTPAPYNEFALRVAQNKTDLLNFLKQARSRGKTLAAIGASTKGNVLLQYCGLTEDDIACVGEVNSEKYGRYTPGTWIPIVPEEDVLGGKYDYLLILPWHFRKFFTSNPKLMTETLLFPLPHLETRESHK